MLDFNTITSVFSIVTSVIGTASAIAAVVPNGEKAVKGLATAAKILNFLAFNFGQAKNKTDV